MERDVKVDGGVIALQGTLAIPDGAQAIVLFTNGSGSIRYSQRSRHLARLVQQSGFATAMVDLFTPEEEAEDRQSGRFRRDIGLLADRLVRATDWLCDARETSHLRLGYLGASTGTAAALVAAAKRQEIVGAVVSRGGRPDLARAALPYVKAPTLLLVGDDDRLMIDFNREALAQLRVEKDLQILPGVSHQLDDSGSLEQVARLAQRWFRTYLA